MSASEHEVTRFFSNARKIPTLIGKLADGTRLPGGPYTASQLGGTVVIALLVWATRGIWATGNLISDVPMALVVIFGTGFLIGRIPATQQSPFVLAGGIGNICIAPGTGKQRGKPIRVRSSHVVAVRRGLTVRMPAHPEQNVPVPATTCMASSPDPVDAAASAQPAELEAELDDSPTPTVLPRTGLDKLIRQTQIEKESA